MDILLAVIIKVVETIAIVLKKELLSHFKTQRKKPPLRHKRKYQGGSKKIIDELPTLR